MKFKSFNIIIFLIFFTLFNNFSFSQNESDRSPDKNIGEQNNRKFSISLKGGMDFETFGNWVTVFDSKDNNKIDAPIFIPSLAFSYKLDEKQFLELGITMVSVKTFYNYNSITENRNMNIYPISVSYKYFTKNYPFKLKLFLGVGISYIINHINIKFSGNPDRIENSNLTTGGYGFELYLGLLHSLYNKINLSTEVKMNYQNIYAFSRYNIGEGGNLSLYILFGVGYTL